VLKRALLFFFLSAGEEEREGKQVLLTWALGSSANRIFNFIFTCLTLFF
jgi:hypothetical protein